MNETEVGRLKSECIQALRDEITVEEQIEDLQQQLESLRDHEKRLKHKELTKKDDTNKAFATYTKAVCREFCDTVHRTFPREVRDLIYTYMTGNQLYQISSSSEGFWGQSGYFDESFPAFLQHDDVVEPCHWCNSDFVGFEMLREIGESYYRTTSFYFDDRFDLISKFRVTDQWKLGFLPVSFVSKVEFRIQCDQYHFKELNTLAWGWGMSNRVKKSPSNLLVELESLFGFKPDTSITLECEVGDWCTMRPLKVQQWMRNIVIPFILSTLQRLKNAGYRVRIVLLGDEFSVGSMLSETNDSVLCIDKKSHKYI